MEPHLDMVEILVLGDGGGWPTSGGNSLSEGRPALGDRLSVAVEVVNSNKFVQLYTLKNNWCE